MCECESHKDARVFEECARVVSNECVGPRLHRIVLEAPKTAASIEPGQFVHMLLPGFGAHILRRPFSVYNACENGVIEIIYQTVGQGSAYLSEIGPGVECSVIAPLGRGWQAGDGKSLIVGGGVGAAPLFMFAKKLIAEGRELDVVLGAQSADMLVTRADYAKLLGRDPLIATDDGSLGHKGFCTDPVREALGSGEYANVYCCGPVPLMHAVSSVADELGVACWVSMEKRMACGVGACLSCVVETCSGKRSSCVDGPVFNAKELVW